MKRTPWTKKELQEFLEWHNESMKEHGYPKEIVEELICYRTKFLSGIKIAEEVSDG